MSASTTNDVRTATGPAAARRVRLIDADVHQAPRSDDDIRRRMPEYFRRAGFGGVGAPWASPVGVLRADAAPAGGGRPGSDPRMMIEQHLDPFGIDFAVLTGSGILELGIHPHVDYATALARAYNDWLIEEWLSVDPRFLGSIIVAPQNPRAAAEEIRRVGSHRAHGRRAVVQVLMCSATRIPYGQRFYWPIYEAAAEAGLPVAVHPGTEGKGIANGFIAGVPSTYFEWHTNIPQNYMGQLVSLVLEGVFEQFPTMKFVAIEGGLAWLPHVMWRLDKNWKALRVQTPWLKRPPSEYIVDHVRLTTQPIEEPERSEQLLQILAMIRADKTVMFSSDYPHWDNDSPRHALPKLPEPLERRIFCETARELYGLPETVAAPAPVEAPAR